MTTTVSFIQGFREYFSGLFETSEQATARYYRERELQVEAQREEREREEALLARKKAKEAFSELMASGKAQDLVLFVQAAQSNKLDDAERDLAWAKVLEYNGGVNAALLALIKPAPYLYLSALTPKGKQDVAIWISTAKAEEIRPLYEKAIGFLCLKAIATKRLVELEESSSKALYSLRNNVPAENREAWVQKMIRLGIDLNQKIDLVCYFAGSSPELVRLTLCRGTTQSQL